MKRKGLKAAALAAILACAMICQGCSRSDSGDDVNSGTGSGTQDVSAEVTTAPQQESAQDSESATDAADAEDSTAAPQNQEPIVPPVTDAVTQPPVVAPVTDAATQPPPPPSVDAVVAGNGTVTVSLASGAKVVLGAADSDVLGALGKYNDKMEAPSCVHPGNDVLYYYNGYTVTTSPNAAGKSIVASIGITSDAVKLANGITVGSSASAVKAAFGDKYTEVFGVITYEIGNGIVQIVCDADTVTAIAVTVEVA